MLSTKFMKCLKKRVWVIWKLVRQYHHVSRDNAPFILYLLFSIQAFIIYNTDFYSNYYEWFDYFDTFIYILITYDVIKQLYRNYVYDELFTYNEMNGISCILLFALLGLNVIHTFFDLEHYIGYYKAILSGGFLGILLTQIKE